MATPPPFLAPSEDAAAPAGKVAGGRLRPLWLLGLVLGSAFLAVVFFRDDEGERSFAAVRQKGVLRVGYAVEAPFAFVEKGQVRGESPEIAQEVCRRLHIGRIEWVQTSFDSLVPDLLANRFDVIAAGFFITPERKLLVAFSQPTFFVRPGLLVRKGNPRGIRSYADLLEHTELKVAAISGSAEERWLRNHNFTNERLEIVPDAVSGRVAVASSLVDALALSSLTIRRMAQADGATLEAVELPAYGDDEPPLGLGAFAFRKEDRSLLEAWNGVLADYIGSAEHRKLVAPLGFSRSETSFAEDNPLRPNR